MCLATGRFVQRGYFAGTHVITGKDLQAGIEPLPEVCASLFQNIPNVEHTSKSV